jgi:DNA-binding NarL/FixJ family response regulator
MMDSQDSRPLAVLLVEDNASHARLIYQHLQQVEGTAVCLEQVSRLSAALQRLGQGKIDVLLLDLSLPDSPIDETLARVLASGCDVPVVVLTSVNDADFAAESVQQGAQDYLPKSDLSGELLLRSIRSAIERKKTQRELKTYTAKLERSNERLRSFAHMLAHEVKSPLTTLSGCL